MKYDVTKQCNIMESVAARRCKCQTEVSKAFSSFMDDLFVSVYSGSTVTIAGFGTFWMQSGCMRFSRITLRTVKPSLNVNNIVPDNLVYINNNNIDQDWPWHNTVRTRHMDSDPVYMSVLVEANRKIYFKQGEFYCYYWNRPVFVITQLHSRFYKNERFKKRLDILTSKRQKEMERLRLWVPRLVSLLLSKLVSNVNAVDDAGGHL